MKNFKGFTLVEVLIVIIIVGILIAALLPRLTGAQATARDTARASDVRQIATSAQLYYTEVGSFPATACVNASHALVDSGYMSSTPTDPSSTTMTDSGCAAGEYLAVNNTNSYLVFAEVESLNNGNAATTGAAEDGTDTSGLYYVSIMNSF